MNQPNEWINVRDKMPDIEKFLATDIACPLAGYEVLNRSHGYIRAENNEFLGWDGSFVEGFADWGGRTFRFTHWMPLPEPPKENK